MWIIVVAHLIAALAIYVNSKESLHNNALALRWSMLGLCGGVAGAGAWSCLFRTERGVVCRIQVFLLTAVVEAVIVYVGYTLYIL